MKGIRRSKRPLRRSQKTLFLLSALLAFNDTLYKYTSSAFHLQTQVKRNRYQNPLTFAYNDNPNPKKIKRKFIKAPPHRTRQEIRIDLQTQLLALGELKLHHHDISDEHQQKFQTIPSETNTDHLVNLESNVLNSIWSSRTVSEVYDILRRMVRTSKSLINKVANIAEDEIVIEEDGQLICDDLQLVGPNIAAAALRRIIDVRPDFNQRGGEKIDILLARSLMPKLVEIVGRGIMQSGSSSNSGSSISSRKALSLSEKEIYSFGNVNASMYQLLNMSSFNNQMTHISSANTFYALAKVCMLQKKKNGKSNNSASSLRILVQKMCSNVMKQEDENNADGGGGIFVQRANPTLLLESLCALSTFRMSDEVQLLQCIGNRLKMGDATGKLNGSQLSLGLWAYASLERPHLGIIKSFSRRLRKKNVRKEMNCGEITRAVWAAGQCMKQLDLLVQDMASPSGTDVEALADEEVAALREESVIMAYTLSGELLQPASTTSDHKKLYGLNVNQIADLLRSYVLYEFDPSHPIIAEIIAHVQDRIANGDYIKTVDISRILWSLQRLRVPVDIQFVSTLVQSFSDNTQANNHDTCSPKTLNTILRSVALMVSDHGNCLPELYETASLLLSDAKYLSKCNEFECSNFIWSFSLARQYDKDLLLLLSNRMRDKKILSSCTPSSASRFLWSFANLVENEEEDLQMKEVLFEMFQALGGILLSTQLTPVDASSAMWAMAKSSYALDMGIFDHLAEVLAVDFMMETATLQQITEACWSCGKMITWEDPLRERIEYGDVKTPPYVKSGERFVNHLVSHCELLSAKDISQTMWAIGRLQIIDDSIISPLAYKAAELSQREEFNSQELANIIWALSKTGFKEEEIVSVLTTEICKPYVSDHATSQEAANVLYALGRMHIRDEETFSCMNAVLMRQLDKSTTQAIANALWAHDSVDLQPPRLLFDSWAKEKLDIVGLYLDNGTNGIEIKD